MQSSSESDPRARPKPHTFYPPKNSPFVLGVVKSLIKTAIWKQLRVSHIEIDEESLQKLRRLRGHRCLLTPSHSGGFEPHIIMYLSKLLRDDYNFVAAVELFEQSRFNRWLMPRMGVYSILRGAADRPSFSMTRQLLASGKRWLVIFPEGQTIWQNSIVIPFQQGTFQLAFKGLEDARKEEPNASLFCIPMAIKYVYINDMHAELDASLSRLESKLDIQYDAPPKSRYARLRRVADKVLGANEKVRGIHPAPGCSVDERIQGMKLHVVNDFERRLHLSSNHDKSLLDRIRALFNAVDRIVYEDPEGSEYEQQLASEQQDAARKLYDDLWRLLQFVAVYDGYVSESMTIERFMDVLGILETEISKERKIWGPRKALLKVGDPIDLRDHIEAYSKDKKSSIKYITLEVEARVRALLDDLGTDCAKVQDVMTSN
ncbi:MAG: 1-acyl-sn-glycerol-3-phosphate acyltransferase [bacterium]|nr:1-acyl-sn-glycerol-3-phosphate acyltransferase [bacterium]